MSTKPVLTSYLKKAEPEPGKEGVDEHERNSERHPAGVAQGCLYAREIDQTVATPKSTNIDSVARLPFSQPNNEEEKM